MPSRNRAVLGLVSVTVLVPLATLLLGLWEEDRGRADLTDLDAQRSKLARVVAALEARMPSDGNMDFDMQFRWGGQTYVGPLALDRARDALDDVTITDRVAQARRVLPPAVVACAGLVAGLSILMLLAGAALGRAGRGSRDALVRGFSLVRRVLPTALGAQVLLATAAFVAAVSFEAAALLRPDSVSAGEIKLLAVAGIAVLGSLWVAASTVMQLRHTLAAFTPDPLPILGRVVARDDAPGLWRLLDALAERLGALRPDDVVVGLTEGFFVSSGPKTLNPAGRALAGRTLYLPLPYLPLMRLDEVAAVIGHELAHFSGGDTDYSLRFLPIYAGVGRSLDALASGGLDGRGAGSPLLGPALRLGIFVMDQFHSAVRHWSRQREFAADAAGASLTSPEAAARALLRTAVLHRRIAETLEAAADAPDAAPADLVADAVRRVAAGELDDPSTHLDAAQPHPTDTHPPTRQRLEALGRAPDPALLQAALSPPRPEALAGLKVYFADPEALCRDATADFLGMVRGNLAAYHAHLETLETAVDAQELVLREGTRLGGIVLVVGGGLVALALLALATLGLPDVGVGEGRLTAAIISPVALALLARGAFVLRRGERPILALRPEALVVPGLDRPIPWDDVAELELVRGSRLLLVRVLLAPGSAFPRHAPDRRVKLDAERRVVTLRTHLPYRMTPQAFTELIGRYRTAAEARRLLAGEAASPRTPPDAGPTAGERGATAGETEQTSTSLRRPPVRGGWREALLVTVAALMFGGFLVASLVSALPVLVSDWSIRDAARPIADAEVLGGSCKTELILDICDATLRVRTLGGPVSREVVYAFTGLHLGDYTVRALADPARPELVSTDLGLDRLWNRTITLGLGCAVLLALTLLPLWALVRNRRAVTRS